MNKKAILEGILFLMGDEGINIEQITKTLEIEEDEVLKLLNELKTDLAKEDRGIQLVILGNNYKLTTKEEHEIYYNNLLEDENTNLLSNAALETLAIIAYNEPVTRIDIDNIRGVSSAYIVRNLLARGFIEEYGKSDLPGKPNLYKTSNLFLDYFGLANINELPKLENVIEDNNDEIDLFVSKYKEDITSITED